MKTIMKHKIISLAVIACLSVISYLAFSGFVNPGKWQVGSFAAGDTTETFEVFKAKVIYLIVTDSSVAGTDSLGFLWKVPTNTTAYQYGPISMHEADQTTTTTDVSSALLIPGDNSTQVYAWYPRDVGQTITGSFLLYRKNVNGYAPKTRFALKYEQ